MAVGHSAELDVVVVGSASTEYVIRAPELPGPGITVRGREFVFAPGGKGVNQAVAAARLGARVAFVGRVGADERGEAVLDQLTVEGVDVSRVTTDEETPTGATVVVVDGLGRSQLAVAPGASSALGLAEIEQARELLTATRVLLVHLEPSVEVIDAAVHLAHAAGARVVLDPAPAAPLGEELLTRVHLIRPSASGAEVLTNEKVEDELSARKAARNLLARGAGAACVAAPGGDLLAWGAGERWFPRLKVAPVDETGADDAFAAGLAVALAEGQPPDAAVRLASVAAALATTVLGAHAGLPRRSRVTELMNKHL